MNARTVAIVIGEGFPALPLACVTEPLRVANRESARPLFDWRVLSVDGEAVRASNGRSVGVDGSLDDAPADVALLLSSYQPGGMASAELLRWLRRRAAGGALMGCVDTGALIFAEAGLLRRRPAAAHQEALPGFREAMGDDLFADRAFDLDGDRCSAAGGVATIDMTLAIIERFGPSRLADRVASILNHRRPAPGQPEPGRIVPGADRRLAQAVEIMQAHLERPLPVAEIAARVGCPSWRLRRLFGRRFGIGPQAYYLEIRLGRARDLLRNSSERVGSIALICGFPAGEALTRAYRARFGVVPSKDRLARSGGEVIGAAGVAWVS
ncbi:MAG: helix-turn-helix domain-containing protein, partial [Pseudomonadota bacterium]